ncbi:PilW family protein [Pseudogulbenkiania subflava]|uniref:Type IV pilin N-term methylation site GFxxxE n=1 Tax=Pseudogulbenkiania subflava DSM 22618 TaxID=1123014 RepID=A0A1Y6B8L9_9NEIS|nr:prepilin-type N-terminal cleavage/methylation domain-containing protein [Pseudogulbenkiania subflava]SME94202.1 Type IV pilin N-term methylation site GFxxxE [Pseudogulbenkiania subflava DSM 22618]
MLTRSRQRGISLIELMVSVGISLVLLLGMTSFLTTSLKSNTSTMKAARLNQELRAIMLLISRDVRRAGYWGNASSGVGVGSAAYSNPFGTVNVATPGCLLYSYDRDGDGSQGSAEQYGVLLSGGVALLRSGGSDYSCTPGVNNSWEALSDSKVTTIGTLSFSLASTPYYLSGTSGPNILTRTVTITLAGQLKNDSSVKQTLTETVKLENDLFQAS